MAADASVEDAARLIVDGFTDYNASFSDITRRARRRFRQRDRAGMQRDAVARIELYDRMVAETISRLEQCLDERLFSRMVWRRIRSRYGELIKPLLDAELNKTFFNTLSRRLFKTRGVDPAIEFVALDIEPTDRITHPVSRHTYASAVDPVRACRRLIDDFDFGVPYAEPDRDARLLAARLQADLLAAGDSGPVSVELLETVFYREGRAFLVGRLYGRERFLPCVIALICEPSGVRVDAVITARQQVSVLFGFTHSYFFADLPTVGDAVVFLRTLLPDKPIDELYTVLGRAKQGKTERYRHFFRHLSARPDEQLVEAEGEKGLVMVVFTLPSYPLVFKVIRDHFAPSKQFGPAVVKQKYWLVFRHDRVGRLVDAQEFKDLKFPLSQLAPALLAELEEECARSIAIEGESLVISHCYVERRLRPLNLHLSEVEPALARDAALDYGQAVKDLSLSNIFPGDLLPKNFGVTRSNRVIFYDYDELKLIGECRFRALPDALTDIEEFHDEPWFHIGENDVFPEQFSQFMGLPPELLQAVREHHPELFDVSWWKDLKTDLADGRQIDILPYPASMRL